MNSPLLGAAGRMVLAVVCVVNAGFGVYVAASVLHDTWWLFLFAIVAMIGAFLALMGVTRRQWSLSGVGAIFQVAAPTGFAWLASILIALVGVAVIVVQVGK